LVVALTVRFCVTLSAARAGDIDTVIVPGVTVSVRVTLRDCAGLAESTTWKVSEAEAVVVEFR